MQAKVITNFGNSINVKLINGKKVLALQRNRFKGELTVGDNVELEYTNFTYVITKLHPRNNLISRPNKYQRKNKNIAANIDVAVIIITHIPKPIEHYIDRYLAALHKSNIKPIIVINKIDDQSQDDKFKLKCITDVYKNIGYQLLYISAQANIGINQLVNILKDQTAIFLGQSGVGKSETLNTILGTKIALTKEISTATKKGCHTTTCSTLYEINKNTNIIDSPGIREFGLWNISPAELFAGFIEFKKYKGICKFRNCSHQKKSKNCEIVKQVNFGNIDLIRFNSYHRILKEIQN